MVIGGFIKKLMSVSEEKRAGKCSMSERMGEGGG